MKYNKDRFAGDLIFLFAFLGIFYLCLYLAADAV